MENHSSTNQVSLRKLTTTLLVTALCSQFPTVLFNRDKYDERRIEPNQHYAIVVGLDMALELTRFAPRIENALHLQMLGLTLESETM